MKTLLLIDGSSYLYRAFHAMPDLRSPQNAPMGAVYGMVNMLKRLEKDVQFDYSACVFDAKGKTFRDDLYQEYKANRPSMPETLASQIAPVHEVVQALGWPMIVKSGVEADDVIGTLAKAAEAQGFQVVISTGDKDMSQLVSPAVRIVNTMSDEWLDEAGVEAKFGVPPHLIIDYLTLVGDTADNVPGVQKCGPKTAVKWLQAYGDLDGVVANAESVGGKVGENLRAALDWLPMGRQLITIKCDVDMQDELPHGLSDLKHQSRQYAKLVELFRDFGFKSALKEAEIELAKSQVAQHQTLDLFGDMSTEIEVEEASFAIPELVQRHYHVIQTQADFATWFEQLQQQKLVAFDTETTSLDAMSAQLVGMSFSWEAGEAVYLPLAHQGPDVVDQLDLDGVLTSLKPWLENPQAKKCGQNLKYDRHVLANYGIDLQGIADDTMLASYVLESHLRHNMDDLALRHLHEETISYESICGKGAKAIGFADVNIATATEYAAEDADITYRLNDYFHKKLQGNLEKVYREIELPVSDVLFEMERNGVLIDRNLLAKQSHELGAQMLTIEEQVYTLAGQPFNLNSPKQLQDILFNKLEIPTKGVKKTASGGYSTDESVLENLAKDYPLPKLILEYRSLAKLKSTYTDKLPTLIRTDTGRVHTNYAQAVAVTGRLASSDPNLQNIPVRTAEGRRVREAFIAPTGSKIVSADYSQIELRIMAHLSGDEGMLNAFAHADDIHRATAAEVFGVTPEAVSADERRAAKAINFGLIYGMSAFGLAAQLDIERTAAQNYIDRYFARYPAVARYMQDTRDLAKTQGYVETVFGRRLYLPEIHSSNGMRRAGAERAAINAPMQGTAADLIKLAMIAVSSWLKAAQLKTKLIMQVHDELILEVPEAELDLICEILPQKMAGVAKLKVPLLAEVGVGDNWDQAH